LPGEPAGERCQDVPDVGEDLADVAGHDQPVVRVRRPQPIKQGPVFLITDVQVADREEPSGHY